MPDSLIRKYFILVLFMAGASMVNAQTGVPEALTSPYINYSKNTIQEKIYVHTDKSLYVPGEITWFKIYTVDAYFHKPLDLSKIAYAELLDSNSSPVLQGKIALENGEGSGSFILPLNLPSGNYRFRAYTNWMKNFPADFYFRKTITIINPRDLTPRNETTIKDQYTINFFPESGNMIYTIPGRVAFKVTDASGSGVDFKGYIVNERQDTAAIFQPLKYGLGNFMFSPSSAHTYKAIISFGNGKSITKDLPAINSSGYAMKLDREKNQVKVSVRSSESGTVYLIAHTGGAIKSAQAASLDNGSAKFYIDLGKLSPGISQFTLFNNDKKPLCERLYFKYPTSALKLEITADKNSYSARKKIALDIHSENETNTSIPANMSVAVYRIDSLQHAEGMDISNYLWLGSDIPGRIESPEYYFGNDADSSREEAMDNLMLTEGWRRFKWDNIQSGNKPAFTYAPEYYGHQLSGKVTDTRTNKPAAGITAYVSVPGTRGLFGNAVSDSAGNINFEMKNFYGNEIIAQTNSVTDSNYTIEINSPYSTNYFQGRLSPFTVPENNPSTILEHSISSQVQHIYTSGKQNSFNNNLPDTLPFYQKPDVRYALDDYTRFTSMEEVFREFIRNVFVSKPRGKFQLAMYQEESQTRFNESPLVLIDGVPVFKTDKVMSYDPLVVKSMDIIAHKYYMGNSIYDGVVSMMTYDGKLKGYELDQNAIVLDYEGLQLQREFYSPEYATPRQESSHLPDFRNLLYWSPEVKTGPDGSQKIEFYSSDLAGKYAVVLQGLTADGRSGSSTITFEVKATK